MGENFTVEPGSLKEGVEALDHLGGGYKCSKPDQASLSLEKLEAWLGNGGYRDWIWASAIRNESS